MITKIKKLPPHCQLILSCMEKTSSTFTYITNYLGIKSRSYVYKMITGQCKMSIKSAQKLWIFCKKHNPTPSMEKSGFMLSVILYPTKDSNLIKFLQTHNIPRLEK